jgi:hypothetical protein
MADELTILYQRKINKYRDYVSKVLQKDPNLIDFTSMINESYILCLDTEYFEFNMDDLCIEKINNKFNSVQCHDVHLVILVELVSAQIRQTENLDLMNQYYHKKIYNIVFEEFIQIFFGDKPLQIKKETIIKNSYNKFCMSQENNRVND